MWALLFVLPLSLMNVLLLTHSGDFFTIDRVQQALKDLGASPIRIDTDLFPQELDLQVSIENGNLKSILHTPTQTIDLDDVKAVWLRRIWSPKIDEDIEDEFRTICITESKTVLKNVLGAVTHAFWFDPIENIQFASNKILQLKLATDSGLKIPQTLITNQADKANTFYHSQESIIAKMTAETSFGMSRTAMSMHTYKVEPEHVEGFESLQYCPMVFQEEIHKKLELRVIYVAGQFFTGAIDASDSEGKTDWRKAKSNQVGWSNYQLPEEIKQKITTLMSKLKLQFGAIDIICTHQEEYVFLEVNPIGEWGMLEKDLNLPISKAIANSIYNQIKNN